MLPFLSLAVSQLYFLKGYSNKEDNLVVERGIFNAIPFICKIIQSPASWNAWGIYQDQVFLLTAPRLYQLEIWPDLRLFSELKGRAGSAFFSVCFWVVCLLLLLHCLTPTSTPPQHQSQQSLSAHTTYILEQSYVYYCSEQKCMFNSVSWLSKEKSRSQTYLFQCALTQPIHNRGGLNLLKHDHSDVMLPCREQRAIFNEAWKRSHLKIWEAMPYKYREPYFSWSTWCPCMT